MQILNMLMTNLKIGDEISIKEKRNEFDHKKYIALVIGNIEYYTDRETIGALYAKLQDFFGGEE